MANPGVYYMINGIGVTSPDEEKWEPIIIGTDLDSLQKRSHWRTLTWVRRIGERCDLDWLQFDNTVLTSLICRPPNRIDHHEVYTDAVCQAVTLKHVRGVAEEIIAQFIVKVD